MSTETTDKAGLESIPVAAQFRKRTVCDQANTGVASPNQYEAWISSLQPIITLIVRPLIFKFGGSPYADPPLADKTLGAKEYWELIPTIERTWEINGKTLSEGTKMCGT
jgi:hypothetical protein